VVLSTSTYSTDTPVITIVGPTASGKSEVAQLVAEQLGGEIISADSMQVYRGLDIGTGKVIAAHQRVPHHLIDVVDLDQTYSAAMYQQQGRAALAAIIARGNQPVVCGGTGLYVRALLDDMDFPSGDQTDNPVRAEIEDYLARHGPEALYQRLSAVDPDAAGLVHPNNTKRVVRALEMAETGTPYSRQASGFRAYHPWAPARFFGLSVDRAVLYRRIEERVDDMIAQGWVEEVESLLAKGLGDAVTASKAIGYRELAEVAMGQVSLSDATTAIKTATRRYAKRQLTWFRPDPRVEWLDVTSRSSTETAHTILALL